MNNYLFAQKDESASGSFFDKTKKSLGNNFNSKIPSSLKGLFTVRWLRVAFCFLLFLFFLFLWKQVGQKFTLLIFTILPLFIGYAFSYLLEPVNNFFCRFFSERMSKIIVFICFLVFTLSIVFGLLFIFVIQLNDLYQKFLYRTGSDQFRDFLEKYVKKDDGRQIQNLQFVKDSAANQFKLSYSISSKGAETITMKFAQNEVAGVFILLLKIATSIPILKGVCFSLINWVYTNLANYSYLHSVFNNLGFILLFLYVFFFTIIIAAFSLGKGSHFYHKIWYFLTKDYDAKIGNRLKVDLKKNLSAWGKGLLIVQLYIFIGTFLFLFTAGMIFSSWSSYDDVAIVLTLFMTLCNLVPYVGPTIGFVPIICIGLIDVVNYGVDSFTAWVPLIIAFFGCFLIQLGESAFISPTVYSYKVNLNPIWIIVGLAVFGVMFGVLWMPIAIPIMLIFKIIYQVINDKEYEKKVSNS